MSIFCIKSYAQLALISRIGILLPLPSSLRKLIKGPMLVGCAFHLPICTLLCLPLFFSDTYPPPPPPSKKRKEKNPTSKISPPANIARLSVLFNGPICVTPNYHVVPPSSLSPAPWQTRHTQTRKARRGLEHRHHRQGRRRSLSGGGGGAGITRLKKERSLLRQRAISTKVSTRMSCLLYIFLKHFFICCPGHKQVCTY